jgi:hypothetical protein
MSINQRGKLTILCIVLVLLSGCPSKSPLHPKYDELISRGFYVYVLPKHEMEERGWSREISIWSWSRHCQGGEISETFNPIQIDYTGSDSGLNLMIGPWDMYWDNRRSTTDINLRTPWALNENAEYYIITEDGKDYVHLRFNDRFKIPVQIVSNLSVGEVVQLINQLEYIGPPPDTVTNPWDYSRCPNQ